VRAYDRRTGHVREHDRGYEGTDGIKQATQKADMQKFRSLWSYRDWQPGEFERAYLSCGDDWECQAYIRSSFKRVESGRYWKAMDKLHSFLYHLDEDERELFLKRNPHMKVLLHEFAVIEELAKEGLR
jgi:hypothetical protein